MSPADPLALGAEFQTTLTAPERHAHGVHYTLAAEIQRVIQPTIVRPWQRRIAATPLEHLPALHAELLAYRVLDPACGCANFLIIAFHELKALEATLLARAPFLQPGVRVTQLLGIDLDPRAVAIARTALQQTASDPAADLTTSIVHADALFCDWPFAHAIVGNPPFQSKNKAARELGAAYLARLRRRWPDVPGRADLCAHWFRRAHAALPANGRAGLVATNTIRDNDTRRASLDHLLANGATITEAVSTQVWPDEAASVHVSIVNWLKGDDPAPKHLWEQQGDAATSPWRCHQLQNIPASLTPRVDVTGARDLPTNRHPKVCFQGITPGHRGFIVDAALAERWQRDDPANRDVLFPYLIGDDLLDAPNSAPTRWLIDLADRDLAAARRHAGPFAHLEAHVLPAREAAAALESTRNTAAVQEDPRARQNHHHRNFLARWWSPAYRREDLLTALSHLPSYIACSRVTRRPIFERIPSHIRPGDALQVFTFADDYAFGVLQSDIHWQWFLARSSALKQDPRYTSRTVYDSFPWPPSPSPTAIAAVTAAAARLRHERRAHATSSGLRALHRHLETSPHHPLHALQSTLDAAVRTAYAMPETADPRAFLLDLNTRAT